MKSQLHQLRGQLFSSTQIPVCLGFLAKNKHDGSVVANELALSYLIADNE